MVRQLGLLDGLLGGATSPVFARHETFHPRFGWLKKGFDAVCKDRYVFSREDAPIVLGVGKNMVRSIRYWCEAFKLTNKDQPTPWGYQLLCRWDPYLEDVSSLWLLHWYLLKPPCTATAWWLTFNSFRPLEFTREDLIRMIKVSCDGLGRNIAESSILKDVSCLLRMYASQAENSKSLLEDTIDSPFVRLGLIKSGEDDKHFVFNVGFKANLPNEVIVFACLDYIALLMGDKKEGTISISRLLYEPNSPGMVFKLSEAALCKAIEDIAQSQPTLHLSDNAGLIQLSFSTCPSMLSAAILESYYSQYFNGLSI
ncbi:MAG: DUF4007 family protein [Acidobacteriota bacterium]|nr:DUF4007 family protein [Acidobacteriota bacterium]